MSSAPVYGELAYAERGRGAYLNGRAARRQPGVHAWRRRRCPRGNLKSLATGPRWTRYGGLVARLNRIRGYGDFLHYHLLAAGKIDAVVETDVNILDIAACVAIVTEAGGRFTELDGAPITLRSTSVLATNGRLHRLRARGARCDGSSEGGLRNARRACCGQRISSAVAGPMTTSSRLAACSHWVAESMRRPAITSAVACGYSGTCRGSP